MQALHAIARQTTRAQWGDTTSLAHAQHTSPQVPLRTVHAGHKSSQFVHSKAGAVSETPRAGAGDMRKRIPNVRAPPRCRQRWPASAAGPCCCPTPASCLLRHLFNSLSACSRAAPSAPCSCHSKTVAACAVARGRTTLPRRSWTVRKRKGKRWKRRKAAPCLRGLAGIGRP